MKKHIVSIIALLGDLLRPTQLFANEAKEALGEMFLANQFLPDKENWVQLAPFGDFPNRDNKKKPIIQRVDKEAAEGVCNAFNSPVNNVARPFGIPFYVGHPDHPAFAREPGNSDTAAKGHGKKMEVRHDPSCATCKAYANSTPVDDDRKPCREHGLFMQVKWNEAGERIVANQEYHGHSVNWGAKPSGEKKNGLDIIKPTRVFSVGFSNSPIIPVAPATLANSLGAQIVPPWLKLMAGFKEDEDVSFDQVQEKLEKSPEEKTANAELLATREGALAELGLILIANAEAMPPAKTDDEKNADNDNNEMVSWLHGLVGTDPKAGNEPLKAALTDKVQKAGTIERLKKARAGIDEAHKRHDKARTDLEQKLANSRKVAAEFAVGQLIKSGHIKTSDKDAKITELSAAEDFAAAATAIANSKPVVKVAPRTINLGERRVSLKEESSRSARFQELIAAREQQYPNEDYAARFEAVGKSDEGQQLLTQMKKPGE